jgi:hypothetical protein
MGMILLQLALIALLGYGAYLAFTGKDRRSWRDRRGAGRGGRRPLDYVAKAGAPVPAAPTPTPQPRSLQE